MSTANKYSLCQDCLQTGRTLAPFKVEYSFLWFTYKTVEIKLCLPCVLKRVGKN